MILRLQALLILWIRLSSAGQDLPISPPKSAVSYGDKFIVKINDFCTGIVIATDWILTAAHCLDDLKFRSGGTKKNSYGDFEFNSTKESGGDDLNFFFIRPRPVAKLDPSLYWTKPINIQVQKSPGQILWRKVDRVILHGKFQGEALSWLGYDLALMHMIEGQSYANSFEKEEDVIVPVCLAEKGFPDLDGSIGRSYMAGFGRRSLPHCFTNQDGPEQFEVCGRPHGCSNNHRAERCGIEFLYKGKIHKECLFEETPSASDPECINLRKTNPDLKGLQNKIHLFGPEGYLTTCYPEKPLGDSKGWCATRSQGIDTNSEPSYGKGWGFCSNDRSQANCNNHDYGRGQLRDFSDMETSILQDGYCVDKLQANLIVEQPGVDRKTYDPLLQKSKLVCIGRNYSTEFSKDLFFEKSEDGNFKKISPSNAHLVKLAEKGNQVAHPIDGGPSCFGDSGGPLWRVVGDPDHGNRPTPVLIGVFSFMLWGTCIGRNEPGYYGRIVDYNDWIFHYVPRSEICTYSTRLNDRRQP